MRRGEVWWGEFEKPIGRRPVLVLSRDKSISSREYVIVAQVTTHSRQIPTEIPLHKHEGMPRESVINLDVINTVPKSSLVDKITDLDSQKLSAVEKVLKYVFELS